MKMFLHNRSGQEVEGGAARMQICSTEQNHTHTKMNPHKLSLWTCALLFAWLGGSLASASVTISTLANATVPADTFQTGTYVALTGPVLDEGTNRDIGNATSTTLMLNAPAGFVFNPAAAVNVTVTRLAGTGTPIVLSNSLAAVTASNITVTIASRDSLDPSTVSRLTWSGIRVRAAAGTPLASGKLTLTGTANIKGTVASTSFGQLTEVPGVVSGLRFATQPAGAAYKTPFTTQPVLKTTDQFGNDSNSGLNATVPVALTLVEASVPLVGAAQMDLGTASGNGTAAFSGLEIDRAAKGMRLQASATGLTGATSAPFDISPLPLSVTGLSANFKTYDGTTDATMSWETTQLVGILPGDMVDLDTSGSTSAFSTANVGSRNVTVTGLALHGPDAANYSLAAVPTTAATIYPATVTISGVTAANRAYDGKTSATVNTNGATLNGVVPGDIVNIKGKGSGAFVDKNVGTAKTVLVSGLGLTGASAANYVLPVQPTALADITPASLHMTGVAAAGRVYDGTKNANVDCTAALLTGVIAGDIVSWDAGFAVGTFASANVGNRIATITGIALTGVDAGNYQLVNPTTPAATITVAPISIYAVAASNKTYDGTTLAKVSTVGAGLSGVFGTDKVKISGVAAGIFDDKNIGTAKPITISGLSLSGTDASNYTLTAQPSAIADITPAPMKISGITAADKVYDATTTATIDCSTGSLVGKMVGDSVDMDSSSATTEFDSANAGVHTATVSGILLTGPDALNYTLTAPITTAATISAAPVTLSGVTAKSRAYNGKTTATIYTNNATLNGVINGDTVTLSGKAVGSFADKNIGTAKPVTISGLVLAGSSASNYFLSAQPSATADITPATLQVTGIVAPDKIYDSTVVASLDFSAAVFTGMKTNDLVAVDTTSAVGVFDGSAIGIHTVSVSGINITGLDAGNYTMAAVTIPGVSILPAPATITGITALSRPYDGTTNATIYTKGATLTGIVSGDDVSMIKDDRGAFTDKTAGTNKTVLIFGFSLIGGSASNYFLAFQPFATADITPAEIQVSGIKAVSKIFDKNNAATLDCSAAQLTGVAAGTVVGLDTTTASGTFDSSLCGSRTVRIDQLHLTGPDAANYQLAPATVTATITQRPLTVSADNKTRNYGEANPTLTGAVVGALPSDNISVNYTTAASVYNPAGTQPIQPSLIINANVRTNYQITLVTGTLTILPPQAPSNLLAFQPLADGNMHLEIYGSPGQAYSLQSSDNLLGGLWTTLSSNTATQQANTVNPVGTALFDDLDATNHPTRFYRIVTP